MAISRKEVLAIADLARLELSEEEVTLYAEQFSAILGYFERLNEVDTSNVEALSSVLPPGNVMRPDVPGEPLSTDKALTNAPESQDDQFRVSAVLDE